MCVYAGGCGSVVCVYTYAGGCGFVVFAVSVVLYYCVYLEGWVAG